MATGSRGWEDVNLLRRLGTSTAIALILSPTGLLLIAVTRLLIISNYNSVTALTVVSSSGYVNTLLGTVIPLIPLFMPYIALVLLFFRRVIPAILALVAAVLISPTQVSRVAALKLMKLDFQSVIKLTSVPAVIFLLVAPVAAGLLLVTLVLFGFNNFIKTVGAIASLVLIPSVVFLYPLPYKNNFYYHVGRVVRQRVCQIGQVRALRPLVTFTPTVTEVPSCVERTVAESHRRPAAKKARGGCPPQPTPIPPQVRPAVPPGYRTIPRCIEL